MNYNNKIFQVKSNAENGETSTETIFHYWQEGNILWATYKGGDVRFGTITGIVNRDGSLDFTYQHVNQQMEMRTGKCHSIPEIMEDGRIMLHEEWLWTKGGKGSSVLVQSIK